MTTYSIKRYNEMVDETFAELKKLAALKGAEYSGDVDRLANFRRNGLDLELPMETVWRIYAAKHWDAVGQYIKDIQNDTKRERLESISGRVDDLLVYLLLFKAMVEERSATVPEAPLEPIPAGVQWSERNGAFYDTSTRKFISNPDWWLRRSQFPAYDYDNA